jgi:hypothetical protein
MPPCEPHTTTVPRALAPTSVALSKIVIAVVELTSMPWPITQLLNWSLGPMTAASRWPFEELRVSSKPVVQRRWAKTFSTIDCHVLQT